MALINLKHAYYMALVRSRVADYRVVRSIRALTAATVGVGRSLVSCDLLVAVLGCLIWMSWISDP